MVMDVIVMAGTPAVAALVVVRLGRVAVGKDPIKGTSWVNCTPEHCVELGRSAQSSVCSQQKQHTKTALS